MKVIKKDNEKYKFESTQDKRALCIAKTVSKFYEMDLKDIFKNTRKRIIISKRQQIHYLCKLKTSLPLSHIGYIFKDYGSGRVYDHCTVSHSVKTVNNVIDTEKDFKKQLKTLEERVDVALFNLKHNNQTPEQIELGNFKNEIIELSKNATSKIFLWSKLTMFLQDKNPVNTRITA